jgi:two-component system sensor histidine kinase RegB
MPASTGGALSNIMSTMNERSLAVAPEDRRFAPIGRVRMRTLILIRWVAIAGQAAALFVVHFALGFELPLDYALAAIAASALLNLALTLYRPAARVGNRGAAILLGFDMVQLAVLLYLTGGLTNPFALLMLAPITISATILTRGATIALCALAIACVTLLAFHYQALPWTASGIEFPPLYVIGIWAALVLGALFIALYAASVSEESRRMSDALAATQMALGREQRISALGALAAAAAHELGSPLGTIAVVARELANEVPKDSDLAADAELLLSETKRCRDILAQLAARPEADRRTPFSELPVSALIEAAAAPHRREGVVLDLSAAATSGTAPEPRMSHSPELLHGLGNLIQNAVQFARGRVALSAGWDDEFVEVTISDDGPGIPRDILDRLGEPYLSSRSTEGEHMGLGVFIATTLLERTGAEIEFANRGGGGARVRVRWPRAAARGATP